jgi:hypothetical protein
MPKAVLAPCREVSPSGTAARVALLLPMAEARLEQRALRLGFPLISSGFLSTTNLSAAHRNDGLVFAAVFTHHFIALALSWKSL